MDGKLILGFINYFMLTLIFSLGLVSVLLKNQRKKLTFLFLLFLCVVLISFLFFGGHFFIFSAIFLIIFFTLLILFVNNQEFYSIKTTLKHLPHIAPQKESKDKGSFYKKNFDRIINYNLLDKINIIISVVIIIVFGYFYITYTNNFFKEIKLVESFNVISLSSLIEDLSVNYVPLIFLIILSICASFIWFLFMIENRRKRE